MPTISELMAGKEPGTVKVTRKEWSSGGWFQPYYLDKDDDLEGWFGPSSDSGNEFYPKFISDWQLYTEPKPKKVWVEWLATPVAGADHSGGLYYWPKGFTPIHSLFKYQLTGRTVEVEG